MLNFYFVLLLIIPVSEHSSVGSYLKDVEKYYKDSNLSIMLRAKTFFSNYFPLADDGRTKLFGSRDNPVIVQKIRIFDPDITVFKDADPFFNYWTDFPANAHDPFIQLDAFIGYLLSNPVHRVAEYAGDEICGSNYQDVFGNKIMQIYTNPGSPIEIPCYTCIKNLTGFQANIYLNPDRDFMNPLDTEFESRVEDTYSFKQSKLSAISYFIKELSEVLKTGNGKMFSMIQSFGYSSRNHVSSKRGGRFQLHLDHKMRKTLEYYSTSGSFYSSEKRRIPNLFYSGQTFHCLVSMDNNLIGSGVIFNVDYIKNSDNDFSHNFDSYDTWNYNWKPYHMPNWNIKADISWRKFSCCSACCCSTQLCGLFASTRSCKAIYSKKVRKGYLSLMKIDPNKKSYNGSNENELNFGKDLDKLFSASPYKNHGIPLFSTSIKLLYVPERITDELTRQFHAINNIQKRGFGVFLEEVSCNNDPQKLDCKLLAKCKEIHLNKEEEKADVETEEEDPCLDVNMTVLAIKERKSYFKVDEGKNYRIRLDPQYFKTDRGVNWKLGFKHVPIFHQSRACSDQEKAIHPNRKDLLLTSLSVKDTKRRIEASTEDGVKVVAFLLNQSEEYKNSSRNWTVFLWIVIILSIIGLVLLFVLIIENHKRSRIKRILKNKEQNSTQNETE